MKDKNVNYNTLEQHTYDDTGDNIFYTCPVCGGEYLDTFIIEENGKCMCIDCAGYTGWSHKFTLNPIVITDLNMCKKMRKNLLKRDFLDLYGTFR